MLIEQFCAHSLTSTCSTSASRIEQYRLLIASTQEDVASPASPSFLQAIDLIDEAGSRVRLQHAQLPEEAREPDKELKALLKDKEAAIRWGDLILCWSGVAVTCCGSLSEAAIRWGPFGHQHARLRRRAACAISMQSGLTDMSTLGQDQCQFVT